MNSELYFDKPKVVKLQGGFWRFVNQIWNKMEQKWNLNFTKIKLKLNRNWTKIEPDRHFGLWEYSLDTVKALMKIYLQAKVFKLTIYSFSNIWFNILGNY